jgi:hypothetical protein
VCKRSCSSEHVSHGDVAQLEEHLLCKQGVVGSSPIISTTNSPGSVHSQRGGLDPALTPPR